jgi:hypothetical protein
MRSKSPTASLVKASCTASSAPPMSRSVAKARSTRYGRLACQVANSWASVGFSLSSMSSQPYVCRPGERRTLACPLYRTR